MLDFERGWFEVPLSKVAVVLCSGVQFENIMKREMLFLVRFWLCHLETVKLLACRLKFELFEIRPHLF